MRSDIFGWSVQRADLDYREQRVLRRWLQENGPLTIYRPRQTARKNRREVYLGFSTDTTDEAARARDDLGWALTGGFALAAAVLLWLDSQTSRPATDDDYSEYKE